MSFHGGQRRGRIEAGQPLASHVSATRGSPRWSAPWPNGSAMMPQGQGAFDKESGFHGGQRRGRIEAACDYAEENVPAVGFHGGQRRGRIEARPCTAGTAPAPVIVSTVV